MSQFIPTIGTYLAGALPMLIAFTVNPWYALWVLIFVVIYQQFENYVLQPKLTSKTVDIHPAVAFGSVIAGTALLGAVGALIAIPAIATLQAFLGAYVKRYDVTDDPRVHGRRARGPVGTGGPSRLRRLWARRPEAGGPPVPVAPDRAGTAPSRRGTRRPDRLLRPGPGTAGQGAVVLGAAGRGAESRGERGADDQPCGSCGLTSTSRRPRSVWSVRVSVRWPRAM